MRVLLVALLFTHGFVGLTVAGATADPIGPICLERGPGGEVLELFAQPSGGSNVLFSGRIGSVATGVPLSGSGYVTGDVLRFSVSGQAPNASGRFQITDGVLNLAAVPPTGPGKCYTIGVGNGCGGGSAVTYTLITCPVADAAVGSGE